MIKTGYYSITDIKKLFLKEFNVGDFIETVLHHPNGTEWAWYFKIINRSDSGYVCELLASGGNYSGVDTWSEKDYENTVRNIKLSELKKFYRVVREEIKITKKRRLFN